MNIKTLDNWLNHPDLQDILQNNESVKNLKRQVAYNLFTLSSSTSHLENFHSDVIASLLNPKGLHECGDRFLHIFIDYIDRLGGSKIDKNDFKNAIVSRETGRLDIWIRDIDSKKSIIIENKINNAVDMDNQINRYFKHTHEKGFHTVTVVYLSLDGSKIAPSTEEHFEVLNIAAFNSRENNLVNGWLEKCLQQDINADSSAVINQYAKLLKHLASRQMETTTNEMFYNLVNSKADINALADLVEIRNQIPKYRAEVFGDAIPVKPFEKRFRYRDHYWLYESYQVESNSLKLDVWFNVDGTASLEFWNTSVANDKGRTILTKVLQKIDLLDEFEQGYFGYAGNGYRKNFQLGPTLASMTDIDAALLEFVKSFMAKLAGLQSK